MSRIRNRRSSGIAYQSHLRALLELDNDFRGARDFVVLVIAHEALLDFKVREQLGGLPRVFASDQVHVLKYPQSAQRNVIQIADWRRHYKQAARGRLRFRLGHCFSLVSKASLTHGRATTRQGRPACLNEPQACYDFSISYPEGGFRVCRSTNTNVKNAVTVSKRSSHFRPAR